MAREFGSILNLDELLTRLASVTRRLVEYRTFGILLLNEDTQELEMKTAVRYGDQNAPTHVKMGVGLVGYAAQHKEPVLVSDVSTDPRYIKVVEDIRSELVVPLMIKDRCIGVFDLESPDLDAFKKNDVQILTLRASQAAVAIENARLYETISSNEIRLEKEIRFAQRVQVALLPTELPKRIKGVDVAARFEPAYELGGDFYDFRTGTAQSRHRRATCPARACPRALQRVCGELVRSRTFRRDTPRSVQPAGVLASMNTILHERQLEPYYCTLCYALFDFKRRTVVLANSGLPYPVRCSGETASQIVLPGVPLGSFGGSAYDEVTYDLTAGDVILFCSDGVFEANDARGREFGVERLSQVVLDARTQPARAIVEEVFTAVADFRGEARAKDDMTVVAIKINS